jgi:hypothetical protein
MRERFLPQDIQVKRMMLVESAIAVVLFRVQLVKILPSIFVM